MHRLRLKAMMGAFSTNTSRRDAPPKSQDPDIAHTADVDQDLYDQDWELYNNRQTPDDNAQFLNVEDLALSTMDAERWSHVGYEMRQDEMGLFVSMFNNSAIAIEHGVIYLSGAPDIPFADKIRGMDWSIPCSL